MLVELRRTDQGSGVSGAHVDPGDFREPEGLMSVLARRFYG